ncbi:integrase [Leifsonia sp. Leaf336]|uniref:site-specific integrase n=1 Tax=Leifsonia sp. Leaf336 TaxID=1736341 RepID=UPI0006F5D6E5|nr:site-specific integrase [Leifsonia sp. Leaf336]KQR52049.1 integrase [Leifsonia sp. Leaf336]
MGTVTPYETGGGRRWRVRYRTPDHRQTDKRGFTTKRDAELFLANVEVSKAAGSYVDPRASRITVGELAVDWLANKRQAMKPSSFHSVETSWRVYVEPRWSATAVGSIRPSTVEQWIRELGEGSAVSTQRVRWTADESRPRSATVVLRALGVLAGILDVALKDGRVAKNVARGADGTPRKHSSKTRRYLSHEEVIRFAEAAETDMQATLLIVLAYCGLRWGEATGLRVRDVVMLRRRLQVNRTATEVNGNVVEGLPKTWEKRSVPFPPFLAEPLARLCEGKEPDDLLFADRFGGFLRRPSASNNKRSWFLTALAQAGLERLTPHDLRHTAASLAVSSGANVKAVQRMLGHKSAAMTLDTYADLFEDDLDAVAMRLDAGGRQKNVGKVWAQRGRSDD